MTLNVCIIGCGMMGREHAKCWAARADAKILSVFDPIPESRHHLAAEYHATAYDSYEKAIGHAGVQVVSVCTPTCFRRPITCFAAAQGRHVLTEKPLAANLADADAMLAAAQEHKILLSTAFQYRGFSQNQRLRELFAQGLLGAPVYARYVDIREVRPKTAMHRESMNRGPVLDLGVHYVDMMHFLTGAEPTRVFATGSIFGRGRKRLAGINDLAIDTAEVLVNYSGGHVLSVQVGWGMIENSKDFHEEMLLTPNGTVRLRDGQCQVALTGLTERIPLGAFSSQCRIDDMAEAVQGRRKLEVTGADGRRGVRVAMAAFDSIRTGAAVDLG